MSKVVTFGEIMLRLNPEGYLRIVQANRFEASFAGGEANVAVSLCNFGDEAAFVTVVPNNEIGQSAVNRLREYGVDVRFIRRSGPRLGVYFVEKGASQRASKVIYDRAGSSISLTNRETFDWREIFSDCEWFHFTGITPALGDNLAEICLDALKEAKKRRITVSCDLNYRAKLWTREKAREVMTRLMPYVDVIIANEEDAEDVFGISADHSDVQSGKLDREGYISVATKLKERFGAKLVAITLRGSLSASDNEWSGMLYDGEKAYFAPNYLIHIVDRVGGGDSFGAGLIHALKKGWDAQSAVNFAVAASCLKQTIEFDFNLISESEALALAAGNTSGRVQR